MSTAASLKKIALERIKEAKVLQINLCYSEGYYLCGYCIECALKVCIANKTKKHDFPDKEVVLKSYSHNLKDLVGVAGLNQDLEAKLENNPSFRSSII